MSWAFARDRTSDKQVQAKGRSDQTYSQVADHQNTQMDGGQCHNSLQWDKEWDRG